MKQMKLKTLKDFESDSADLFCDDAIMASDLRQEAIKWVSLFKKLNKTVGIKKQTSEIVFFKHFFNIEEDLK